MSWSTPAKPAATTVVTQADTDGWADDLTYLHTERVLSATTYKGSANPTTTSATFADADATNLIATITPTSTRVRVTFCFSCVGTSTDGAYDIYSVGLAARFGDATTGMRMSISGDKAYINLVAIFQGLAPGVAQTFKLQFKSVTAGQTTTIHNNGYPIVILAEEC